MTSLGKHVSSATNEGKAELDFPAGFMFGAASSAYQIEGAWNIADKSMNIWDDMTHTRKDKVLDGSTGDVACDSYHLYKRDVEICKELGLHFYRFSISWCRLCPEGFAHRVSEDGKRYYNALIDELIRNGIKPVVTLYHWDLPKRLQDLGGWTNPLTVDWLGDYARVAYSLFGDRVKTWVTVNEPLVICNLGYSGAAAPAIVDHDAIYLASKNTLLAHARAWRIYNEEFRHKYHGMVGLTNQLFWFEPVTEEDEDITNLVLDWACGRFCHPIFSKEGGWPPALEKAYAEVSAKQGYLRSKLPAFTKEEKEYVRGTYDYFGLNFYTSRKVRRGRPDEEVSLGVMSGIPDLHAVMTVDAQWKKGSAFWFYTLLAIKEDEINVIGYTAWTLFDNFEWWEGYLTKFGLYEVDFSDPNRTRSPRKSAKFYAEVIKRHSLDIPAIEWRETHS